MKISNKISYAICILSLLAVSCNRDNITDKKLNSESEINQLSLERGIHTYLSTISNNHIRLSLPSSVNLSSIEPNIIVSDAASYSPHGKQDFSKGSVEYTIVAENGNQSKYNIELLSLAQQTFSLKANDESLYSSSFNLTLDNKYNPQNNYLYSQASSLAYEDETTINARLAIWKEADTNLNIKVFNVEQNLSYTKAGGFTDNSSRFILIYNTDYIVIAFRGSSNYVDWYKNLKLKKTRFTRGEGSVHLGFYETVLNMKNYINQAILSVRTNNQKIYITGHSLGGAQALLSVFMCTQLEDFSALTTFGQPRVGDFDFFNWTKAVINSNNYFRMVNKRDPVTNVPYWGYYHIGSKYANCYSDSKYNLIGSLESEGVEYALAISPIVSVKNNTKSLKLYIPFISNHFSDLYMKNAKFNKSQNLDF